MKYTKAAGFHGTKCWDCYVKLARAYYREWRKPTAKQLNQLEQA